MTTKFKQSRLRSIIVKVAGTPTSKLIKIFFVSLVLILIGAIIGHYKEYTDNNSPNLELAHDNLDIYTSNSRVRRSTKSQSSIVNNRFAQEVSAEFSTPEFIALPTRARIDRLNELYRSKPRGVDDDPILKKAATSLWKGAYPEEREDFTKLVGNAPIIEKGKNVDAELRIWRENAEQNLIRNGINPSLYGDQLDEHLDEQIEAEKQAYLARNRTPFNWAVNRVGNYAKDLARGVANLFIMPLAFVIDKLENQLEIGDSSRISPDISNLPNKMFGSSTLDFIYATDGNGYPRKREFDSFYSSLYLRPKFSFLYILTSAFLLFGTFLFATTTLLLATHSINYFMKNTKLQPGLVAPNHRGKFTLVQFMIILLGAMVILFCLLYPPHTGSAIIQNSDNIHLPIGHHFILEPPNAQTICKTMNKSGVVVRGGHLSCDYMSFTAAIDVARLVIQVAISLGITLMLFMTTLLFNKQKHRQD